MSRQVVEKAGSARACALLQPAAWGVENRRAQARQRHTFGCIFDGGIDAGEPGGGKPPRRLSGGRRGRSRRQRRSCPHSCGRDCPARCGARCAPAPQERAHERGRRCVGWCIAWCASRWTAQPTPAAHGVPPRRAEATPAAGAAGQGERGEHGEERIIASAGSECGSAFGEAGGRGCRAQRDGRRGVRSARERVHVAGGVIAVMSGAGHGMGAQHHAGRREGRTRCRRSRRRGRCRSRTDRRDARSRRSRPGRARPVTITDAGGAVAKRRARHVAVAVPEDGSAPNPQGVAGGNRRAAGDRRSRSPVSSSAARPRAGRAASARTASPPQRRRSETKRAAPPAMR